MNLVSSAPSPAELLRAARASLEAARDALNAEIRAYPAPISGCDAQYNHLLGERRRVQEALVVLEKRIFVPTSRIPEEPAA